MSYTRKSMVVGFVFPVRSAKADRTSVTLSASVTSLERSEMPTSDCWNDFLSNNKGGSQVQLVSNVKISSQVGAAIFKKKHVANRSSAFIVDSSSTLSAECLAAIIEESPALSEESPSPIFDELPHNEEDSPATSFQESPSCDSASIYSVDSAVRNADLNNSILDSLLESVSTKFPDLTPFPAFDEERPTFAEAPLSMVDPVIVPEAVPTNLTARFGPRSEQGLRRVGNIRHEEVHDEEDYVVNYDQDIVLDARPSKLKRHGAVRRPGGRKCYPMRELLNKLYPIRMRWF